MTTLSVRLAELRQMAELSASELGGLAGLSRATVSMIESGKRPDPAASTISSLARVLGDRRSYLLSGTGEPPTKEEVLAAVELARAQPQPELPEDETPPPQAKPTLIRAGAAAAEGDDAA